MNVYLIFVSNQISHENKITYRSAFFESFGIFQAVIELNPDSCESDTGLVEITSGTFYLSYQWLSMPNDSSGDFEPVTNATSPNFSFDWTTFDQSVIKVRVEIMPGVFYFSNDLLLDRNDCDLSNSELGNVRAIRICPNPATDFIKIKGLEAAKEIEVFNALGQMVFTSNGHNPDDIDVSSFLPGNLLFGNTSGQPANQAEVH